jgi:hypothetical protein
VTLRDGQRFEQVVLRSKGTSENPMTAEEVTAKFMAVTSRLIARDAADDFVRLIGDLENIPDVRLLTKFIGGDQVT